MYVVLCLLDIWLHRSSPRFPAGIPGISARPVDVDVGYLKRQLNEIASRLENDQATAEHVRARSAGTRSTVIIGVALLDQNIYDLYPTSFVFFLLQTGFCYSPTNANACICASS